MEYKIKNYRVLRLAPLCGDAFEWATPVITDLRSRSVPRPERLDTAWVERREVLGFKRPRDTVLRKQTTIILYWINFLKIIKYNNNLKLNLSNAIRCTNNALKFCTTHFAFDGRGGVVFAEGRKMSRTGNPNTTNRVDYTFLISRARSKHRETFRRKLSKRLMASMVFWIQSKAKNLLVIQRCWFIFFLSQKWTDSQT